MRLLFDQNLSHRIVGAVAGHFGGSLHVRDIGLAAADDLAIWHFAANNGFTIVSKDADFRQLSFLLGFPPKVIWLRLGNCSTDGIIRILSDRADEIHAFGRDAEASMLVLS